MKLTGKENRISLTINGKRCGVKVSNGPWIEGVDPQMIKITPKKHLFPREFKQALSVQNNSDSATDYFEADQIKIFPGHALYKAAKKVA
jgi:hypothetical protein